MVWLSLVRQVALPVLVTLAPLQSASAASQLSGDPLVCSETIAAGPVVEGNLTQPRAIALALASNPELVISACELNAADGRVLQAGLLPNPELGIEVENFAGSGSRSSFDQAETTLQVSQLFELGGKRAKRIVMAGLDRNLRTWDLEAKRLDVITETRKAFVGVLAAQRRHVLASDLASLANEVARVVAARVKAGRVSPVEETRARIAATKAELEITQAQAELAAVRKNLAAKWGAEDPTFAAAEGEIERVPELPAHERLEAMLRNNPDLARWATEIESRRSELALAQTTRVPDLTVSGGLRQFADSDDVGVVVAVSVPLPLFNRGQGKIAESQYRITAAEVEQRATQVRLTAALQKLYQSAATAQTQLTVLRDRVLPSVQQVFDATTVGYRQGKFGYIDVLDAQRTLFETRNEYLVALVNFHSAIAEVERLVGEMPDGRSP